MKSERERLAMRRARKYILKLKDAELAAFSVRADDFGVLRADMEGLDESRRRLLPMPMVRDPGGESFLAWARSRAIPRGRAFSERILAYAGCAQGSALDILDACKGLSPNDSYWLDDGEESPRFDEISLFGNPIDEALSLVALTGCDADPASGDGFSPELTTGGSFPKAWRREEGGLVLCKAGTGRASDAGMEPYSEFLCAQVAERMGIAHVEYGLERWKGRLVSTCRVMNDADTSFVPFCEAADDAGFPGALRLLTQVDPAMAGACRSMLVFDAVVCNVDRHGRNFGILRDNATGEAVGMAPLFDHNLALFPRAAAEDFPFLHGRSDGACSPANSGVGFAAQAALVMCAAQHEQVCRLAGFEFENHPRYPMPEDRLAALNGCIAKKAEQLAAMPVVDEAELAAKLADAMPALAEPSPLEIVGVRKGRGRKARS